MRPYLFLLALLLTACNEPTPTPSPSPGPAPSPSASPSPSSSPAPRVALVSSSADPKAALDTQAVLILAQGEIRGIWLKLLVDQCTPITVAAGASAVAFRAIQATAITPSYTGAAPTWYDRLEPVTQPCQQGNYFLDVTGHGVVIVGNAVITLIQTSLTIDPKPSMPLYVGLNPSYTHVLGMDSNVSLQGPVATSTVQLLRAHRIEPFSQNLTSYVSLSNGQLDLDKWTSSMASFRQLVLNGAIAPPCLVPPLQDTPSVAYLGAVQAGLRAGTLPAGAWAYGWDEDQLAAPASALARINAIKSGASLLNVVATREESQNFASVDTFVPILDWFKKPGHVQSYLKPYGLYTSCMAQGACSGGPRTPSGAPMLVADAPAVHPLAFPLVAQALGAKLALYYSAVEHFGAGTNYFANGNGDGQLLYAGDHVVYPSVRLKLLREGMFMAEYMRLIPSAFQGLVTSGTSFSQDYAAFQKAREMASASYL